ncbi:MAG TPA: type II secretion system F family protein [Nitrospinota bacterium]|nr:type II secretion system F family protein [Nitrospinota bacterium]
MPSFKYVGKTRSGTVQEGEVEAKDRLAAAAILRRRNITVQSIKKKSKGIEIKIPTLGKKIKDKDIVIFTRQFATMIDAGLPLVQCLDILGTQTDNKAFGKIINQIKENVESGATFNESLRKHPNVFSELYTNMVEAGETGGVLDTILNRLSAYMEKSISLKKKIKSALVYPASIICIAILVVIFLMIFVIPIFAQMFAGFGQTLPIYTRIVIGLSNFMTSYILFILAFTIGAMVFFRHLYKRNLKVRRSVDSTLLKLPIFGTLIQKVAVAKFTRTLGTLVSSGVPIIEGLEITAKTSGNKVVEGAVISAISSIKEGQTIAEPLSRKKVFPPMVVQMINVGENTGALDTMLSKIADFYEEEVDASVAGLTSLLEPLIMAFLGVIIGFVVVAMYLPIFKLATFIK